MAYSVQIYKVYLSKEPEQIQTILENEMRNHKNDLATITKVNYIDDEELVRTSLQVDLSTGIYHCDVTINQPKNLLLIQAPKPTRHKIKEFLAKVIEDKNSSEIIHDNDLDLNQSLELFERIADEDNDNIIEILTIHFELEFGHKYGKEIYTELSYKFIQDRCASDHRDFKILCKNGKRMTMKLVISKCRDIVKDDPIKLVIKPNCSFRAYTDIKQEVWDDFCFTVGYVND